MKTYVVTFYERKLYEFLNTDRSGDARDLWRYLEKGKVRALRAAQKQVGVKTGALRKSITASHFGNIIGQQVIIKATRPYALDHHEGTRAHIIHPKGNNVLVFRGKSGIIATRGVRHPGTKPNKFLSDQLPIFVRTRF